MSSSYVQDSNSAAVSEYSDEKDFVLFVDKEGKFSGDYDAPSGDDKGESQSAINEETGEINWDCPCLQSALAPPCGEYFRAAFSCFVASKTEPKGSDCLEQFAAMQDCFRAHPEIYLKGANELDGEQEVQDTDKEAHNEEGIRHSIELRQAEEQLLETPTEPQ